MIFVLLFTFRLAYARDRIEVRRKAAAAFGFMIFSRRKRCFNAWKLYKQLILEKRELKARAAMLLKKVHGRKALLLWKSIVQERHHVAVNTLKGMYHNKLLQAFHQWVDVNIWKRDVEDKIRAKFLKDTKAATEIQRRWKGRKTKREIEVKFDYFVCIYTG